MTVAVVKPAPRTSEQQCSNETTAHQMFVTGDDGVATGRGERPSSSVQRILSYNVTLLDVPRDRHFGPGLAGCIDKQMRVRRGERAKESGTAKHGEGATGRKGVGGT